MSYFKGIGIKSGSYAGKKLPLVGLLENKKHTIFNEYTVGSGVGASSVATRRLKKQRARIKKCPPSTPIIPELNEYEYFEISDDINNFDDIQDDVENMELEKNVDLKGDSNIHVDRDVITKYATSHIEEVSKTKDVVSSLTFTTISVADPENVNVLLSSTDLLSSTEYIVTTSINYVTPKSDSTSESQYIEHTFINTLQKDGERFLIEYIMTITVFESLQ